MVTPYFASALQWPRGDLLAVARAQNAVHGQTATAGMHAVVQ